MAYVFSIWLINEGEKIIVCGRSFILLHLHITPISTVSSLSITIMTAHILRKHTCLKYWPWYLFLLSIAVFINAVPPSLPPSFSSLSFFLDQITCYNEQAVSQWLNIRLQMIGVFMITAVSFLAVLEHNNGNSNEPGLVGLSLSYALSVTSLLQGKNRRDGSLCNYVRDGKPIIILWVVWNEKTMA